MRLSTAVPHAQGATGRVLRATDEANGREVAIKVLRGDDPLWAKRMAREAEALKRLRHRHICPILAVTEYDAQPAIVLPFIDGEPIDRALANADLKSRLAVMRDVIAAVQSAHHEGIIHRDLKPANVLVERIDGRPHAWVLDFGLARRVNDHSLTAQGQILGTPGYLAPEQAQGRPADVRSDIYALGVMLFELLSGRLPYAGSSHAELLLAAVSRDAPSLRSLDPTIPVAVAQVVQKCLERKPSLRYASAGELHDDLLAIEQGRAVNARSIGPLYRMRRRIIHSPLLSAAISLALVAILVAGWVSWRATERQSAVITQGRALEQRVLAVERDLQLIYSKPTHDIRAEVDALTRQALIEAEQLASVTTGPVAAAAQASVGRLHLAIGDTAGAVEPLERAWYAGQRDAELVRSLREAHAALYLDALASARRLQDESAYAAAAALAEQQHGSMARRLLAEAESDDPYAAALLARLDGDLDGALAALSIAENALWPVPAWLLSLRLLLDEASRLHHQGEFEGMAAMIARAGPLADQLSDRVRSHPEAWRLGCRLDELEVALAIAGTTSTDGSLPRCQTLRQIDPDRLANRLTAASAYSRLSRYQRLRAEDPRAAISTGLDWLADAGESAEIDGQRGALLLSLANYRQQVEGRDALDLLQQSAAALRRAVGADPGNPAYLSDLAAALRALGSALYIANQDGDAAFAEAVSVLANAADRHPEYLFVERELISLLTWQAYERYIRGGEAQAIVDQALQRAARATLRWPDSASLHAARGMAARTAAEYQLQSGLDPTTAAELGLAAFERSLAIQPEDFAARFNQSGIPILMAQYALSRGAPVQPWINLLDEQLGALRTLIDNPDEIATQVGFRHALAAHSELALGRWPDQLLSQARERLGVGLSNEWDRPQALLAMGGLALRQHRAAKRMQTLDLSLLAADLALLGEGLREAPQLHELRLQRAALIELGCRSGLKVAICAIDPGQERQRALDGNPLLAAAYPEPGV